MFFNVFPQFLFDADDGAGTGGEAPPETDPVDTEPEPTPSEEPTELSSPWANDVKEVFTDPDQQVAVDQFLREKYQPYVTKLEQEGAENRKANNLWNQLTADQYGTFEKIADELYEPEVAARIKAAIDADEASNDDESDDNEPLVDLDDLPPEVREAVEYQREQKNQALWNKEMSDTEALFDDDNEDAPYKGIKFEPDLFYPFISAADGDFEAAAAGYAEWAKKASSAFGLPDEITPPTPPEEQVTPPTAINSGSRQAAPPPQDKKYDSLDAALDDFLAEENAPPPVVGNS